MRLATLLTKAIFVRLMYERVPSPKQRTGTMHIRYVTYLSFSDCFLMKPIFNLNLFLLLKKLPFSNIFPQLGKRKENGQNLHRVPYCTLKIRCSLIKHWNWINCLTDLLTISLTECFVECFIG